MLTPIRIHAIARNTFTELVRQKVFYFLLIFGLVVIGNSAFLAKFSFQEEFQMLKDVSLGAMINLCQSRTDLEAQTFCYGFGEGVYQGSELTKDPKAPKTVCLPAGGVARDEVLSDFIRWAIANPQFHQEKAAASILRYLPIRFPCKG
jgi:hypothetical protein